jgi:hypothetical protein
VKPRRFIGGWRVPTKSTGKMDPSSGTCPFARAILRQYRGRGNPYNCLVRLLQHPGTGRCTLAEGALTDHSPGGMMSSRPTRSFHVVAASMCALAIVGCSGPQATRRPGGSVAPSVSSATPVRLDREHAIARVISLKAIVLRADTAQARPTSRGVMPTGSEAQAGEGTTGCAWVVAVTGEIQPPFGHGERWNSGTWTLDASTGDVMSMTAQSATPRWFETLSDRC